MPPRLPVRVRAYTAVSALGSGNEAHRQGIQANRSGLTPLGLHDFGARPLAQPLKTWVGRVEGLESPLPPEWARWDCRNNRLAWLGLQSDGFAAAVRQAADTHGAHRVAVVLGSSTASVGATEDAYQRRDASGTLPPQPDNPQLHTLHSLAGFAQVALGVTGHCLTISTACSSSAKAFASAQRLLALDLADAVVVGGVDSLCGSVVFGFHALQLVSPDPCQPFDIHRRGINLGEAAAFALLERGKHGLQLLGCGESSDAHHLSAPQPDGRGALAAMQQALAQAGLAFADVDHVHAHGTATPKNDSIEAALLAKHLAAHTRVSSTKGLVGHTLGAAGALGAVFSLIALESGTLPGTVGTRCVDAAMAPFLLLQAAQQPVRTVLSNAFGFGGSNGVLLFGSGDRGA